MHHAEFRIVLVEDDRVFIVDPDTQVGFIGPDGMQVRCKSVTNDAEWVWEQVAAMYPARRLIYRDTRNRWDEIVPVMPTDRAEITTVNFRPYTEEVPF